MVVGLVGPLVDGSQLELVGGYLVVSGFDRDAELERLILQFTHEGHHTRWYGSEVVVFELLIFGRLVAD